METLAVTLPPDLKARLDALAAETGQTLGECLLVAVREYVEAWETHLTDVHQIDEHEARAVLNAVNGDSPT
ncbi:ribbon-helix-helix protein, CopG family [Magnetospirillum fulvum]|uniref:Ribbon-helix-helix protein, copG family n=1 Tax=Magnetospirillum fulvum TaxID=1082 RepID=A0A1H6GXD8_MAGFU|nr:ribbon-helix-helix protein, CopG family [Magnetospirillum fulvum]SEH27532.1 Ribbon-helix-helix protein, copG family [Magnetospirillum fulvum]